MSAIDTIFYLVVLLMSVVVHEVCHGFMAEHLGDSTARDADRLTMNPLHHLDPFGSVIFPLLLYITSSSIGHPFVFGWAKPVPYNPDNLRNRKWGSIAVAAAGVIANLVIALIFGGVIRLIASGHLPVKLLPISFIIVTTNLALAVFNLVPIPPLDGSKILYPLLPRVFLPLVQFLETHALIIFLIFIYFFSSWLYPILAILFHLITGLSF